MNIQNPKNKKLGFKSKPWLTPKFVKLQRKLVNFLKSRATQSEEEKQLEKTLKRVMLADFKKDNPERKFRFEHIEDALRIHKVNPWPNIIFVYGKKNIGKSWALARKLRKLHDSCPGAQFVFVRNKLQDKEGVQQMISDDIWPIVFDGTYFIWKKDLAKKKQGKAVPIAGWFGYGTGNGFQRLQGGSFSNVKLIVWDECNDVEGNKFTPDMVKKFVNFTSSVIRDKTNVEIYMTGNLLSKNDRSMNIFLDRLKVDPKTNLKFIDVEGIDESQKEIKSRLLYINALDDYRGIESQKGLATQFLTDEEKKLLFTNQVKSFTGKSIYNAYDFSKFFPIISICFTLKEEGQTFNPYILYLGYKPQPRKDLLDEYIIWIDRFDPEDIKLGYNNIITIDENLCNGYIAPLLVTERTFIQHLKILKNIQKSGQLWFGINDTEHIWNLIWEKWQRKIETERKKRKIVEI